MEPLDNAIKPGDTVILHLSHNNLIPVCVIPGFKTDTRNGTINHNMHFINSNRYFLFILFLHTLVLNGHKIIFKLNINT